MRTGDFEMAIFSPEGIPKQEFEGGYIAMERGEQYAIMLTNHTDLYCNVALDIGITEVHLQLEPYQKVDMAHHPVVSIIPVIEAEIGLREVTLRATFLPGNPPDEESDEDEDEQIPPHSYPMHGNITCFFADYPGKRLDEYENEQVVIELCLEISE